MRMSIEDASQRSRKSFDTRFLPYVCGVTTYSNLQAINCPMYLLKGPEEWEGERILCLRWSEGRGMPAQDRTGQSPGDIFPSSQ